MSSQKKEVPPQRDKNMKNFKELREKLSPNNILEKKEINYVVKDAKSAEFIKNELSGLVKADFRVNKKGSKYHLNIVPKTDQDEKIVKSFMDDAKIEMLKDEFVRALTKVSGLGEEVSLETNLGETILISPKMSSRIIEIHDTLNRDNQEIFMEMLVHSSETFEQIKNFCETYAENKGPMNGI